MKNGYIVEIDNEKGQICIIPSPSITTKQFSRIMEVIEKDYKWWLPADHRKGFLFSKIKPKESDAGHIEVQ